MKKFSRIIALVLAFVMIAGSAASVFAFTAEQVSENWYDGSIDKLYAWGIINKEHRETAQTNPEEKLDRHIFALWIARILTHEFGEDIWWEVDNKTTDSDDFNTG
ncbi:MAG: hypothetical protein IJW21_04200, partial [Clostridia bacterium]|nr:hypothetical protein [Clostridia bacterium]